MASPKAPPKRTRLWRALLWLLVPVPKVAYPAPGPKKRIAFIKRGPFSHTNTRVGELLARHFPEYLLEPIDLDEQILRREKGVVLLNILHVFRFYGWDILRGRRSVRACFYRTPFIFRQIKTLLAEHLEPIRSQLVFSIQTQSLYDASVPGLPHFVYTDHTHLANLYYPTFDSSLLFSREWIDFERDVYRSATRVFIMSHHVARSIIEHYGGDPGRITCIYAGSNVATTPRPLDNDGYRNQRIVFVGVEWERKGGPLLLESFKRVQKALPKASLTIVGSAPKVNLPGVHVVGRVPLPEVETHLLQASVFCMPTKVEPFGIAPIEALAHKIPVVASRIGALPDIIQEGKTGLLVAPESVEDLAAALISLLSDPEKCRRFGELGSHLVKETYSWSAVGLRLKQEITADLEELGVLTPPAASA